MEKMDNKRMKPPKSENPIIESSYHIRVDSIKLNKSAKVEINFYANTEHHLVRNTEKSNLPKNMKEGETYQNRIIRENRAVFLGPDHPDS